MKKIAIIIPAYNEEENLPRLVDEIKLQQQNAVIFIVDDSKHNNLENILKNKNQIYYFHRGKKLGRGSAVIFGLTESLKKKEFDIFIEMDADFSHNPNELENKIKYFFDNDLDLLISSRYLRTSKIINWGWPRRIFSKMSNFLAIKLLKIPVTDYTNGYRFYSRRAVDKVVNRCGNIGDGFIVLSEILVVINSNRFKIGELDTVFVNRNRGESSVSLKLIIQSLIGLIKLYFLKKKNHGI